jgi:hypothetical protein
MASTQRLVLMLAAALLSAGCATLFQSKQVVLVREPGERHYGAPNPVADSARRLWEYAVLSSNVYHGEWKATDRQQPPPPTPKETPPPGANPYVKACVEQPTAFLPIDGWRSWRDFPSRKLRDHAAGLGLYVEVWESTATPQTVAVMFRGTEFESPEDWKSNLRWFTRFIPGYEDQYTLLAKGLGQEFVDEFVKRKGPPSRGGPSEVRVVAAGHSLGGGLAQHFAYSLPLTSTAGVETSRVTHVYAFDPSPVTGWYSVDRRLRTRNATGLEIDRVFEHGEILAYVRLLLSYIYPPSAGNPAVREIRYNFVQSANPLSSHSMLHLACDLALAAGQTPAPAPK